MNNPQHHALGFLRDFGPLVFPAHGEREPWQIPYDSLVRRNLAVVVKVGGTKAYQVVASSSLKPRKGATRTKA
jgi:hypothetical protein